MTNLADPAQPVSGNRCLGANSNAPGGTAAQGYTAVRRSDRAFAIYAITYGVLVVAFYGYVVVGLWLTITFLGLAWVLPVLIGLCAWPLALCSLCARFRFPSDKPGDTGPKPGLWRGPEVNSLQNPV